MIRKVIQYYYDLYPEHIDKENEKYIFSVNNTLYYFEQQRRSEEELNTLNEINKNVNLYNPIIVNKFKRLISNYRNRNYILIKIVKPIRNLRIEDVLTTVRLYNNKSNNQLSRTEWNILWEKKIDNIEYQQRHITNKFPLIDQSLGYYIGMSEGAIAYFKEIARENIGYYISHIRINNETSTLYFYDPQNIVIDSRGRDIAEYLKSSFINKNYNYNDIVKILEKFGITDTELRLIFCRLNFPSFYFDLYEDIINGKEKEEKIDAIIKRSEEYKEFLKNIFYIINKKINLKNIEWVTK